MLPAVLELVSESIELSVSERNAHQSLQVELFLSLIRNLCYIENTDKTSRNVEYIYSHVSTRFSLCVITVDS